MFNLDSLTSEESNGFQIKQGVTRRSLEAIQLVFSLSYELSSTRIQYNRTIYGVFDYLSDIGGLSSAI